MKAVERGSSWTKILYHAQPLLAASISVEVRMRINAYNINWASAKQLIIANNS